MKIEQIDVVSKEDSNGKYFDLANNIYNIKGNNIGIYLFSSTFIYFLRIRKH